MEFQILGPLEVVGDLGPIGLGGPQQRRVLAVLLSDPGKVLTYDRLIEVLWPDSAEPLNARRSAITYVSRLRSAIGEGVVQTTDAGYVLDAAGISVDADRFVALLEQARRVPPDRAVDVLDEALGLWRGPVFGDLCGEWWARPLVSKLEELRLTALGDRIDALTANGWDGRALAEATSLLDAHPLREQFVERCMRGLHSIGQTADALRVFHRYRTELAEQTGLDPSAALTELESSMATGSALTPTSADVARPLRGYVLRELLGEGSFGAVYRATQPGVDRDVAVKVIRAELADDRAFVRRFEAEAQLVARLEHPHIVPLYDFWRQPGGAFLVFRLMRGGSAEALLRRDGPLSLERAGAVLRDIGGALTAAHNDNVVHRDVKPANILFDDVGSAYLADFGIAATTAAEPMVPQRWSAGSALYASPEQMRDGIEDAAADQYALAVTVWELLTGRTPFAGADVSSVVSAKLRGALGPVDQFCPTVPSSISAVLSRAGAVHPGDRYPTVADFVIAWDRAFTGAVAGDTDRSAAVAGDIVARVGASTMAAGGAPVANPYKGLRPFREGDAADFHGRDALVERLSAAVKESSFVAVIGPSGSGKSSLVLGGLVPRLRAAGFLVVTMTPSENPLAALAAALSQVASGDQADLVSLAAIRRPDGVREAIKSIADDDEMVIVIDQMEELWTMSGDEERHRFLTALMQPIESGFARVVGTVRADFFDRPLADPTIGALASQHAFGVTPMSAAELHAAISLPAEQLGVRFEPALVSQLVAETIDQPGSLPLLQFTLAELFDARSGAVITTDAYNELGGLAGALSRQAEEIFESFGAADRLAARRLFSRLVTPGDGAEDTRRRVTIGDLAGVPERVVAAFVNRRLVTSDRDRVTREPIVEVAHEVLLRAWPRLRGWLSEDRSWLRELRALSGAAAQWDAAGRDSADLYRGARLAVVGELAAAHDDALTELEQQFLALSLDQSAAVEREAQRRLADKTRQNRRLRRSLVGIAVLLVMSVAAGAVAVVQRSSAGHQQRIARQQQAIAVQQGALADAQRAEAERQKTLAEGEKATADGAAAQAVQAATTAENAERASRLTTLASRSLSIRSSQRDLAALLAVEAWKRSPDATSKSALFGTFTFDPGFLGYLRFDGAGSLQGVAIPGTTRMLIAAYPRDSTAIGGRPRVVDAVTGALGVELEPLMQARELEQGFVVSGNGKVAAEWGSASYNGPSVIGLFDLSTGKKLGASIPITSFSGNMALDSTGSRLVIGTDDAGTAAVLDTASGRTLTVIAPLPNAPKPAGGTDSGAYAFGPDGRLYVGTSGDTLRVFDAASLSQVGAIPVPAHSTGGLMRISADGATMVARGVYPIGDGRQAGVLARIDLVAGRWKWEVSGARYGYGECASFAFSLASDQLWCGNYFGLVRERSLTSGERTGRVLQNQKGWASNLEFVPVQGGSMLAAVGNNDGVISRWRVDGGGPIQRLVAAGHTIVSEFSDGKTLLVTTGSDTTAPTSPTTYSLWDTTTDAEVAGLPDFVNAYTIDNKVYGALSDLATAAVYDVVTKQETTGPLTLVPMPVTATSSDDGAVFLLGYSGDDGGRAVEFETATGKKLLTIQVPGLEVDPYTIGVTSIAINRTKTRIYLTGHGLFVFDAATGVELAHNNDTALNSVKISSQGVVVGARYDGTVGVFDPETLREVGSLAASRGFVQHMRFSDDGLLFLAGGNDATASIYDMSARVRLGDPIETGNGSGGPVDLRGDGLQAAIEAPNSNGVVLWDLQPDHWIAAACAIAGRNLTKEEWSTYVGDLGEYRATCPDYPAAA